MSIHSSTNQPGLFLPNREEVLRNGICILCQEQTRLDNGHCPKCHFDVDDDRFFNLMSWEATLSSDSWGVSDAVNKALNSLELRSIDVKDKFVELVVTYDTEQYLVSIPYNFTYTVDKRSGDPQLVVSQYNLEQSKITVDQNCWDELRACIINMVSSKIPDIQSKVYTHYYKKESIE